MTTTTVAEQPPPRFDHRWLPLAVTTVGAFMAVLDTAVVYIALLSVLRDFYADLGNGQLAVTAYLMVLAVVIPLSGFLGEGVGMRRLYMLSLAGGAAGSALRGLSWNEEAASLE